MRVELKQVLEFVCVCVYMWMNLIFTFTVISYTHKHVNKIYSYIEQYLYFTHIYWHCGKYNWCCNLLFRLSMYKWHDWTSNFNLSAYLKTNKLSVFTSQEKHATKWHYNQGLGHPDLETCLQPTGNHWSLGKNILPNRLASGCCQSSGESGHKEVHSPAPKPLCDCSGY